MAPGKQPRPGKQRRNWIAAGVVAALLLWWLWPETPPAVEPMDPVEVAQSKEPAPPKDKPEPKAKPKPKDTKPLVRAPPKQPEVDAKALRDAIAQRSKDLEVCNASGAPERLHARLMMTRQGTIKTVTLSQSGQLPAAVATCVRDRVRAWKFPELALASDVDVMVTFSLTPGLVSAPFSG